MNLKLERLEKNKTNTIGSLIVEGTQYYTLEDTDRGLTSEMSLDEIKNIKVHAKTAIPTGTYEIAWTFSERFKRFMPQLLNVPGFAGIRIHVGNTEADTEGCLLFGKTKTKTAIQASKVAIKEFETWLLKKMKTEKVFITIN